MFTIAFSWMWRIHLIGFRIHGPPFRLLTTKINISAIYEPSKQRQIICHNILHLEISYRIYAQMCNVHCIYDINVI